MFSMISQLKGASRQIIRNSNPRIIYAGVIYILLSVVISELSSRLMGMNMSLAEYEQYFRHVENGDVEYAMALANDMLPSTGAYMMNYVLNFVANLVHLGFVIFVMHSIRGTGASYGNLLDGFGFIGKYLVLSILVALFTALWTLLLIIPGIIAAHRYSMASYIMLDNPGMSASQCIKESKEMMKGHKWELFVLNLTFLPLDLLCMLPVLGYFVMVWYIPYQNTTILLFYERLKREQMYRRQQQYNQQPYFNDFNA